MGGSQCGGGGGGGSVGGGGRQAGRQAGRLAGCCGCFGRDENVSLSEGSNLIK